MQIMVFFLKFTGTFPTEGERSAGNETSNMFLKVCKFSIVSLNRAPKILPRPSSYILG